ncbi:hypothetical protein Acr_07g0010880 [Actinidia rufa]|uniref:Uncharacterized protein n=1 Tax=Actinidia rufa TaxID=165716 RepID=A0A7J0EWX7_9ERIC|nr:hypothetical protein Acr_07g0010880 [Actinidia rufa]
MMDKVNQLPSSPLEDSPPRNDTFDHEEDPKMAIRQDPKRGRDYIVYSLGRGKCCNKLPILTDVEDRRLKRVFKKLGLGGYFKVPVVFSSKMFEKCFALNRKGMASNSGDNSEDNSVEEATNARTDKDILPSGAKSKGKEDLPPPAEKKAKMLMTSSAPAIKGAKPAMAPRVGTSANPGTALGPDASMLGNPFVAENILVGRKASKELKEKIDAMARLEEEVAELKKNEALAK